MISVASTRKLFYSTRRICHEENKSECFSELASVSVAGVPDHAASNLIVYSLPLAAGRISRHLLPRTRLSTQEISLESSDIQEQIKQFRRKISMIRDLIEQMDVNYQSSKRFMAIQRYRLMKNMIKTIIYNKWI
ncbi:hypothetical protein LSAT2_013446 [Lamellibrachia satsuma]|nr:hypothetical protein LSAT2_013446 [Lamellibrachia satsuma]